jgi:hypothetical protein
VWRVPGARETAATETAVPDMPTLVFSASVPEVSVYLSAVLPFPKSLISL